MSHPTSLQSFYLEQTDHHSSCLEQTVYQFLQDKSLAFEEAVEDCQWQESLASEDKIIENWKQILAINLLNHLGNINSAEVIAKIRIFERHPWNQNSQYFRSLVAVNHALAKMPIPETGPHLLESGAALIELKEYCPWLALPFTPQHYEFTIFICILALMTKREDLEEIVLQLARWQLNTLDAHAQPLKGLFVREKEGNYLEHLSLSYLLFRAASALKEETPFALVSQKIMSCIQEQLKNSQEKIPCLLPLIEKWLENYPVISNGALDLSEHIYDPSTALVGYRSPHQHAICTLHGAHTGLGSLRFDQVEIVSYGPQYLPLGECLGFGIEGNALSDQGIRRSVIEWKRQSFSIKGCTRLVDQPSISSLEADKFRGIWLEVIQEFKKPHFCLDINFLGLEGWESVAFSFFIKASKCHIENQTSLSPRTLNRFEGESQNLRFEHEQSVLELKPLDLKGKMKVIPLAGGANFWGADFLVAYLLLPDQCRYQWQIGPVVD